MSKATFTLPKSDCGHFIGGLLTGESVDEMIDDGAPPHGIIIWYKNPELVRVAMKAISDAHWTGESA